jgi:hypothetical protein
MHRVLVFAMLLVACRAGLADTARPFWGARAAGLAGAYTAVAEGAAAPHWNPAGLPFGPLAAIEFSGVRSSSERGALLSRLRADDSPGEGSLISEDAVGVALGLTVLGVAISRFTHTHAVLSDARLEFEGLETWELAGNFAQSIVAETLTAGATVRWVRGKAMAGSRIAADLAPSDRTRRGIVRSATEGPGTEGSAAGLDLGLLYRPRPGLRLGLAVRNVNEPGFGAPNGKTLRLERHARAGVAFERGSWLSSFDVDLLSRSGLTHGLSSEPSPLLESPREVAGGLERKFPGRHWVVRGGVRAEWLPGGLGRPAGTAGFGFRIGKLALEIAGIAAADRTLSGIWFEARWER